MVFALGAASCPAALAQVTADDSRYSAFSVQGSTLELKWADAEDVLRVWISPSNPTAGEPLAVTLRVGPVEGPGFQGPVTVSLRQQGEQGGRTVTLLRDGEGWRTTFTPGEAGRHVLDVTYRTTRTKSVHATFDVSSSPVPRLFAYALIALLAATALGYGVRQTLRQRPVAK